MLGNTIYEPIIYGNLVLVGILNSHFCCFIACVAGPQFYGGPDLQRAGFWRAQGTIEGLQESPPFMTTRPSHNIIN
jgi:hypothetical protein